MRAGLAILLAVAVSTVVMAQDFARFRIPTHSVYRLSAYGVGNFQGQSSQSESGYVLGGTAYNRHAREITGQAGLNGDWYMESEKQLISISGRGSAQGDRYRSQSHTYEVGMPNWSDSDALTRQTAQSFRVDATVREYPLEKPFGISARFNGGGYTVQEWNIRKSSQWSGTGNGLTDHEDHETWYHDWDAGGTLMLGYGKVRSVSSVYDVWIVEQRLLDLKVLTRPLSDGTRQKLIDLLYMDGDYSAVHEEPAKHFWREVENLLVEDGGLSATGLDAYALYRIAEPYFARYYYPNSGYSDAPIDEPLSRTGSPSYAAQSVSRRYGYWIGAGVNANHQHQTSISTTVRHTRYYQADTLSQSVDYDNSVHQNNWRDDVALEIDAEYHLPYGPRWQFDVETNLSFPRLHTRKAFSWSSYGRAAYIVADRWLATANVSHNRMTYTGQRFRSFSGEEDANNWSVSIGAGISYFVQERLSVSLELSHYQNSNHQTRGMDKYRDFSRRYYASIGLNYNILGKLSAPGLVLPSELLPFNF